MSFTFFLGVGGGGNHLHVEGDVVVEVHRVEPRYVPDVVQEAPGREGLGSEPRGEGLPLLASEGRAPESVPKATCCDIVQNPVVYFPPR